MKIHTLLLSFACMAATSAAEPLRPTAVADVSVVGGFWGPRVTTNATVTLPHNLDFIEKTGRMGTFDRAAGVAQAKPDNDVSVVDSDVHKILEGAAYTLQLRPGQVDPDAVARQVSRVIAAQEDDGFLCPRITVKGRESRWENLRKSHVLYSAGHLFESGVAWKQATGRDDLLNASVRFADLIDGHFGPGKVHDVPGHQEIEMALIRLHQATGERRYLDLCRFFLDQRGHLHGGTERVRGTKPREADYNQDRVPLKEAEHAVGHAVRAGYTYAAMADVARIRPDHGYDHALDALWEDVVARKLYLTGASATAQYDDEGFGDPHVLPNETAYINLFVAGTASFWPTIGSRPIAARSPSSAGRWSIASSRSITTAGAPMRSCCRMTRSWSRSNGTDCLAA